MSILWLHGLEGSPTGHKATELRRRGLDLLAPDGRGLPLAERVAGAERALDEDPDRVLVGSSYGGLAAAAIASRRPLRGLLLLAPALHHSEPPVEDAAALRILEGTPTIVLHGTGDAVVPIAASRALAQRCPHVQLRELDDGHALADSLDAIEAAARELIRGAIDQRIVDVDARKAVAGPLLDHLLDPDPDVVRAVVEAAIRWIPLERLPRADVLSAVLRSREPALRAYREAMCARWQTAGLVFGAVAPAAHAEDVAVEDLARAALGLTRKASLCDVCARLPQGSIQVRERDELPHAVAALVPGGVLGPAGDRSCPLCGATYSLDDIVHWDEGTPTSRVGFSRTAPPTAAEEARCLEAIGVEMRKVGFSLDGIDRGFESEWESIREVEARVLEILQDAPESLLRRHPELARWKERGRVDAVSAWHRWA